MLTISEVIKRVFCHIIIYLLQREKLAKIAKCYVVSEVADRLYFLKLDDYSLIMSHFDSLVANISLGTVYKYLYCQITLRQNPPPG